MRKLFIIWIAFALGSSLNAQTDCGPGTYWDAIESLCLPSNGCPGDLDNDGVVTTSDLLELLIGFGDTCSCQSDSDDDGVCDEEEVLGCTDVQACNYSIVSTEDNGSCVYPPEFYNCNGNCIADNDGDGICNELEIFGCTIDAANNYDPMATEDDGSCEIFGCIVAIACNFNPSATIDDGNCFFYCPGCTDISACNYDSEAIQDDGTCTYPIDFYGIDYVDCDGICLNDVDGDGICAEDEIVGCTDGVACNYNPNATDDNGMCDYATCAGCLYEFACNYDPEATIADNASCEFGTCSGCTDSTACNYNPTITVDDGSCDYSCIGCRDDLACNYNANATVSDGSCTYASGCDFCTGETDGTGTVIDNDADDDGVCDEEEVVGCQDYEACNYNVFATDLGECTYAIEACAVCSGEIDGSGAVIDNDADADGVCDWDEILGCQDSLACNYDAAATDAFLCDYATEVCAFCSGEIDGSGTIIDNDADNDGVCDWDEVVGCQNSLACNYNAAATDSAACAFATDVCSVCSGQIDGTGVVIDNDADDDGVCDWDEVVGCQDGSACNFNTAATDESWCVYAVEICEICSGAIDGTGTVVDNDADDDGICDDIDDCIGYLDLCGVCNGDDTSCDGCDGIPASGLELDDCGVCGGDNSSCAGCLDETACNYDASATIQEFVPGGDMGALQIFLSAGSWAGEISWTLDGVTYGAPFGPAEIELAVGTYTISGTDSYGDGWNGAVMTITDSGSGASYTFAVEGSSGSIDVEVTGNDLVSSCDFSSCIGCVDSDACNYNIEATVSGVCIFAENCQTCSGEVDGTGVIIDNDSDCEGGCSPMDSPFANGGCVTYDGDYAVHTFTTSSEFTVYQTLDSVSILVVGGGGGGRGGSIIIGGPTTTGTGAGAGGVVWIPKTEDFQLSIQSYSIVIGQGGIPPQSSNIDQATGGDTSISGQDFILVAKGGGHSYGGQGGSGGGQRAGSQCSSSYDGGATQPGQPGYSGLYGYGHSGSPATNCQSAFPYQILTIGGAGGGAGGPANGGTGGIGLALNISGTEYVYATGGNNSASGPSPLNFGDGGRGGGPDSSGAAGVVIIRYKYQ